MLQLRLWLWLTLGMARMTFVEFFFLVPRSGFAMVVRRVPILMLVGGAGVRSKGLVRLGLRRNSPAPDIALDAATKLSIEAGHGWPCGILLSLSQRRGGVWHYLV
jgi:hypothetical protein